MALLRVVNTYNACVARAPYLTNCATGFVIAAVGDYGAQRYFEKTPSDANRFQWDSHRSLEMGTIRAGVITPFVLKWYPLLARACPGTAPLSIAGRVLLDQFIGSPVVIVLVFAAKALLSRNLADLPPRVRDQFFVTWKTGSQYWPFVHCINFGFVPLHHQPLVAHIASVYWNAVLSYYSNIQAEANDASKCVN